MIDEILTVRHVGGEPGDRTVTCPHCGETIGLPPGPIRGETFQHRLPGRFKDTGCLGWFEVAHDAHLARAE